MRAKPILSLTLLAAALALPGTAASVAWADDVAILARPAAVGANRAHVRHERRPGSVTARIADVSLYRQNSLTYQGVLSRARITIDRLPNGGAMLKVTTPTSVSEPYLDLLVEVNWASGRVVRATHSCSIRRHAVGSGDRTRHPAAHRHERRASDGGGIGRAAARGAGEGAGSAAAVAIRFGAAIRCRALPATTSRRVRRSSRCWSRSTTPTRPRSTAT
jgi:pilus assembly protein FimV